MPGILNFFANDWVIAIGAGIVLILFEHFFNKIINFNFKKNNQFFCDKIYICDL